MIAVWSEDTAVNGVNARESILRRRQILAYKYNDS